MNLFLQLEVYHHPRRRRLALIFGRIKRDQGSDLESKVSNNNKSESEDKLLFLAFSASSVQAKKNPMPSIPCNQNKKDKFEMQMTNDLSTTEVLELISESPLEEPTLNGGGKKGKRYKILLKKKCLY